MEYYSAIKKNKILPFAATWMDLEGTMLSEVSQRDKDKYCHLYISYIIYVIYMSYITYMWNLKITTNW